MPEHTAGYREIEHTADWELLVWAPDLPALLEQAARGMFALSQTELAEGLRRPIEFELPFSDRESLLVDFLAELLFFAEEQNLAPEQYQLNFDGINLKVSLAAAPILSQAKEIKAVTYHRLQIRATEKGIEVNIVFDV
ncbi:MAG: archease [Chloroflexi bacterium]|jgi:SHS2 domain-containing protein|nr:archease [Chloroflexota bacterium]